MIKIPEHNCINCAKFSWCDGDYCCTKHLKILQEAPDANFNDDILMALSINKDCNDWEDCGGGLFWGRFLRYINERNNKNGEEQ